MGIEPTGHKVNLRPTGFEDRGRHQSYRHFRRRVHGPIGSPMLSIVLGSESSATIFRCPSTHGRCIRFVDFIFIKRFECSCNQALRSARESAWYYSVGFDC